MPVPNGHVEGRAAPNGETAAVEAPRSPASLPPQALELASRVFDLARTGSPLISDYLSAGIPPNLTNSAGDTILMLAAYHGHVSTVRTILENGADVNLVNGRGQTPLSGAVFKDYKDVVQVLVEHGADATAGRPNAMETAGMFGRRECAEIMGLSWEDCVRSVPEGIALGPHGDT